MGRAVSQFQRAACVLALFLQALGRAAGDIAGTTDGCDVTLVSSSEALQQAITARACLIKIVADLDLTAINNGTANSGSVYFPPNPPDTAIWGDCSGAEAAAYGRPHTEMPSAPNPPRCKLLTGPNVTFKGATGRLWMSNLVLQPALPDTPTAPVTQFSEGELWMVDVDAVNYASTIVQVSGSPAYLIDCIFSGPTSSEPLLVFSQASGNVYFLSSVDLPSDNEIQFGPVYVGQDSQPPAPVSDFEQTSISVAKFSAAPLIVVVDDQSLFLGLTPDTCSNLCIGYPGQGPRPDVYVSRIQPTHPESPLQLRLLDGELEPAEEVSAISWGGDVKPKDGNIDAWLLLMSKASVAGIDKALQPTGINSVSVPGAPMLRPYGSMQTTNVFKIVFLSLSITVVLILLVVAPVCYAYRRVKDDKAEMLELQVQTPDDLEMPEEGDEEADSEDEDVCPDVRPPRRLRNWRSRARSVSSSGSLPEVEAVAPAATPPPNERAVPLETLRHDFHIDDGNSVEVASLFWGANSTIHRPAGP